MTDRKIKDKQFQMRINSEDYEIIEKKAEKLGMSVAQYLIFLSLNAEINMSITIKN